MAAGTYNFTIEQGATYAEIFVWKNAAGNPYNLSGYSARMQMRATRASTQVLDELTTENGKITLGGGTGTITLLLSATVTAAYNWATQQGVTSPTAAYDLELVRTSDGFVTRLLKGTITLDLEVTR